MVEKAAEREIYDALHCSDLVAFLRRQNTKTHKEMTENHMDQGHFSEAG
jgi:predicted TPR repeat methyltransferase